MPVAWDLAFCLGSGGLVGKGKAMHPHRMATAWHGIASHASKGCAAAAGWAHAPASSPREDERECERRKGVRDQVPGLCVCVSSERERAGARTDREL